MTSSQGNDPSTVAERLAICPYLLVASGQWRNAEPSREHVCMSEEDPVPIGLDTQRRLCFDDHRACVRYQDAAQAYRTQVPVVPQRPIARTAPVVVERGRQPLPGPRLGDRKMLGQALLVVAMIAAAGALILARVGSPTGGAADGSAPPSPRSSVAVVGPASPSPRSPVPSASIGSSPSPAASPSPSHTPKPSPTRKPSGKTYTVKPGDTLSSIAVKFATTVKVLSNLNGIADPKLLKPGQVLKLP